MFSIGDTVEYTGKPYGKFTVVSIQAGKAECDFPVLGLVDSSGIFIYENANFLYFVEKGTEETKLSALKNMFFRYIKIGRDDLAERMLKDNPEFIELL